MKRIFFLTLLIASISSTLAQDIKLKLNIKGVYNYVVVLKTVSINNKKNSIFKDSSTTNVTERKIPANYLPSQFILEITYSKQRTDKPKSTSIMFFANKDNLSISLNPEYSNNKDSLQIIGGLENSVYPNFMNEVQIKLNAIMSSQSEFSLYKSEKDAKKAKFKEYNQWIANQEKKHENLFVSHLFKLRKIYLTEQANANLKVITDNYFHYFDFSDSLVTRTKDIELFFDQYVNIFGQFAKSQQMVDSLFTMAGSLVCEKIKDAPPSIYGWTIDYFYNGYQAYNIQKGIKMLETHINNPKYLSNKRAQILLSIEGAKNMNIGKTSAKFQGMMGNGENFYSSNPFNTKFRLLVFYESDCSNCKNFIKDLREWINNKPDKAKLLDIVTIAMDDNIEVWKEHNRKAKYSWTDIWVGGLGNSTVVKDYYIMATPTLYIIDQNMKIAALPSTIEEIVGFVGKIK